MLKLLLILAALSPAIDPALAPPPDAGLAATAEGGGVQVYACETSANGQFAWTFIEPEATLYDAAGKPFGTHGRGPTWTALDGSQISADAKAPLGHVTRLGAVPELLLRVTGSSGSGILAGVRFVQRIDTVGGAAPLEGCDSSHADERRAVPYGATYRFFK
jgi:hypothetical protein